MDGDVDLGFLCQDKWEKICSTQESVLEVFEDISLMSLDILMQCTFSRKTNCQINRLVTGGGKKHTFVCHYLNHLLTYLHFLSSTHDHYTKGIRESSEIIHKRIFSFLYHHDIIFKFSSQKRHLQKIVNNLNQYTGISWVWVARVHTLS